MTRLLVMMGSGETAPTMIKPHREFFARLGDAPAVVLDTPYGFQENADDISDRAVAYFDASVGRKVNVVSWRSRDLAADRPRPRARRSRRRRLDLRRAGQPDVRAAPVARHRGPATHHRSAQARRCGRLRQRRRAHSRLAHGAGVRDLQGRRATGAGPRGSTSSAQVTGMPAVVVPHYDNAEGGHHDTRFCYLGERRLSQHGADAAGRHVHHRRRRTHRRHAGSRRHDGDGVRQRHDDDPTSRREYGLPERDACSPSTSSAASTPARRRHDRRPTRPIDLARPRRPTRPHRPSSRPRPTGSTRRSRQRPRLATPTAVSRRCSISISC